MSPIVPVIVVGGTLNSLGVIRSLASGRMPIYLFETNRCCVAAWSRYCTLIRVSSLGGRGLIDDLVAFGSRLESRPILILTSDESVEAVSARRSEIEPLFRISLPSAEMVETLADKTLFQALAEREGFAVPRAVTLASRADLALLQALVPPLIIKPAKKTLVLEGIVERAERADSLHGAQIAAERMLACAPRIIVQEWIDGPDTDIFFTLFSCDRHGKPVGLFAGRKLVCSPPAIGNTAICVAAPEVADELSDETLRFIERVRYRGLGSLEFKRDSRTGQFVIIEPTVGRTDWQEEIATLCGMNLPLLTYWAELDRPASADPPSSKPIAWRSSMDHRVPQGALYPGTRLIDGLFRWSDPLPAAYWYCYERIALRLWNRIGRLFSAYQRSSP
jgi:D-aspartate ligase